MIPVNSQPTRHYGDAAASSSSAQPAAGGQATHITTFDQARSHVAAKQFPDKMQAHLFLNQLEEQKASGSLDENSASLLQRAATEHLDSLPTLQLRGNSEDERVNNAEEYLRQHVKTSGELSALAGLIFNGVNDETGADDESIRLLAKASEKHHDGLQLAEDNTPLTMFVRPATRRNADVTLSANAQSALNALRDDPSMRETRAFQRFGITSRDEKQAIRTAIQAIRNPRVDAGVMNEALSAIRNNHNESLEQITQRLGIRDMAQLVDLNLEFSSARGGAG